METSVQAHSKRKDGMQLLAFSADVSLDAQNKGCASIAAKKLPSFRLPTTRYCRHLSLWLCCLSLNVSGLGRLVRKHFQLQEQSNNTADRYDAMSAERQEKRYQREKQRRSSRNRTHANM